MYINLGMKIEFTRLGKRILHDAFEFVQNDIVLLDEKNNIIQIGIETTIQLTECDGVWVSKSQYQSWGVGYPIMLKHFPQPIQAWSQVELALPRNARHSEFRDYP